MAWTTPVIDRALSDITGRTSEGFFNVADWDRINGNTAEIKMMLEEADYLDIPLYTLTPPTITTIPAVGDINQLIENIERVREAACLPPIGLVVLPYDYVGGANEIAPDYEDVNDWENNLRIIYEAIPKAVGYRISCGVAVCGQSRMWQHRFR
jgi:hypothetical protein